jgi:tetratricopeptide (TPR) repeat protein
MRKTSEFNDLVKTAESFDSKPAPFYHELAEYLEDRKLYLQAESYFKKAVELRPKYSAPRTSLGLLDMRLGKEKEGKEILTAAAAHSPELKIAMETWKEIKFEFDTVDKLDIANK